MLYSIQSHTPTTCASNFDDQTKLKNEQIDRIAADLLYCWKDAPYWVEQEAPHAAKKRAVVFISTLSWSEIKTTLDDIDANDSETVGLKNFLLERINRLEYLVDEIESVKENIPPFSASSKNRRPVSSQLNRNDLLKSVDDELALIESRIQNSNRSGSGCTPVVEKIKQNWDRLAAFSLSSTPSLFFENDQVVACVKELKSDKPSSRLSEITKVCGVKAVYIIEETRWDRRDFPDQGGSLLKPLEIRRASATLEELPDAPEYREIVDEAVSIVNRSLQPFSSDAQFGSPWQNWFNSLLSLFPFNPEGHN